MTASPPPPGNSQDRPRTIGILGGGVCGLAAAYRLLDLDPSLRITILESEERTGGLARTLEFDGLRADLGPHRIHTELDGILDFVKDMVGTDILEVERSSQMWLEERWIQYPPRPLEMLGLLGPIRLAGFTLSYITSRLKSLAQGSGASSESETFRSLMENSFGSRLYDYLVRPYTEKVWKTPPESLHADVARVRVSAGGLGRLVKQALGGGRNVQDAAALRSYHYIRGGIGRLSERFTEEIVKRGGTIRLNRTVVDLFREHSGTTGESKRGTWTITHVDTSKAEGIAQSPQYGAVQGVAQGESGRSEDTFDAVVSTLPVTDLVRMISRHEENENVKRSASSLRFLANLLVFVVVDRRLETRNQWLYFPQSDVLFNRGYVPSNFDSTLGKDNRGVLCLEVTCFPGDATWALDDEQLRHRVVNDAIRTGIVSRDSVVTSHVFRIPYSYPFYSLDYREKTDRIWEYLLALPGLLSTGRQGLFLHNNIDHSVFMGLNAAETLVRNPANPGPEWYSRVREFQGFRIVD